MTENTVVSGKRLFYLVTGCILFAAVNGQSGSTSPTKVVGSYGIVAGDLTCAKTIEFAGLNAPLQVPHNAVTKNNVDCSDTGGLVILPWSKVAPVIQTQITASPLSATEKSAYADALSSAASAVFARGQDTTAYDCGGVSASTTGKQVYTWVDNAASNYIKQILGAAATAGAKNGDIFMQVWTPPTGFDAFSSQTQPILVVVPGGGCWYRMGAPPNLVSTTSSSTPTAAVSLTPTTLRAMTNATTTVTTTTTSLAQKAGGTTTTSTTSTTSKSNGTSCFPGHARVTLENGRSLRMDELSVGDSVMVGPGKYSKVFMFTHRLGSVQSWFTEIRTASGERIQLSSGHYLYVNGGLAAADTVSAEDRLELSNGTVDVVTTIRHDVLEGGLYNPITLDGSIVVDGIRASTYTTNVAPSFAHVLLSPLRVLYKRLSMATSVLETGGDRVAFLAPAGKMTIG